MTTPLAPNAHGILELRVFLDHSVLEGFAGNTLAITSRVYPMREDSLGLTLEVEHGNVTLQVLDLWSLKSIWSH
jgi:beta-fructofuranosidase